MREVTDTALLRLYWACRSRSGFPGHPLDESKGNPSTTAILDAMGLTAPSLEDIKCPANLQKYTSFNGSSSARPKQPGMSPKSAGSLTEEDYLPSHTQSPLSMSSMAHSPQSGDSLATTNNTLIIPATPPEMDISGHFQYAATEHPHSHSTSDGDRVYYTNTNNSSVVTFDINTYLDTSSCTIPNYATSPVYNAHNSIQYDTSAINDLTQPLYSGDRSSSSVPHIIDSYLPPWPGTLAATVNTVDRNVPLVT
jgi:hypothetical protein